MPSGDRQAGQLLGGLRPKRGQVAFRVIHAEDTDFLFRVFASTRDWEFQHSSWTAEARDDFLRRQFKLQDIHYQTVYPACVRRIITLDDRDIGRLYIDRQDTCMRIIEFSLLPEACGRGIGTDILRSLLNEAHGGKVPVRLFVEQQSPAVRLYLRHGFTRIADSGYHFEMEWRPATGPREI